VFTRFSATGLVCGAGDPLVPAWVAPPPELTLALAPCDESDAEALPSAEVDPPDLAAERLRSISSVPPTNSTATITITTPTMTQVFFTARFLQTRDTPGGPGRSKPQP
jgi:hypothetical protein